MTRKARKPSRAKAPRPDRPWLLVKAAGTTGSYDNFLNLLRLEDDQDLEDVCYVLEVLHGLAKYEIGERGREAPSILPSNVVPFRRRPN